MLLLKNLGQQAVRAERCAVGKETGITEDQALLQLGCVHGSPGGLDRCSCCFRCGGEPANPVFVTTSQGLLMLLAGPHFLSNEDVGGVT